MSRWPAPPRRLFRWVCSGYLVYLGLSFAVILPALNIAGPWAVSRFLNRELSHELILFNPFTLALELRGAEIREADGHRPLALRLLRMDLSMSSLWRQAVVFDRLRIDELEVHVLRHSDGHWHFSDLIADSDTTPAAASSSPAPAITVKQLDVDATTLRFTDRSRPGGYRAAYHDLAVDAAGLSTRLGSDGRGRLELHAASGGSLFWDGQLRLGDAALEGQLSLERFDLTHLWRYAAAGQPFDLRSAELDLALPLKLQWGGEPQGQVNKGSLRLHRVQILPGDSNALPDTSVSLAELRLNAIDVDSRAQRAQIEAVDIRGFALRGFDDDGEISLLQMLLPPTEPPAEESPRSPLPADDAAAPTASDPASAWQFGVATLSLDDSRLDWRSEYLSPPALQLTPLSLRSSNLNWPGTGPSTLSLDTVLNGSTSLSVSGEIDVGDGGGALDFALSALPVSLFNPLLANSLRANMESGSLSLQGALSLADSQATAVSAGLELNDFALRIHGIEETLLGLESLRVTDLQTMIPEQRLILGAVELNRPQGVVRVLEDGSLNIRHAMLEPSSSETADDAPEPADTAGSPGEPWTFRLERFALRDGQLDFADASLPLPFKALIADINGDLESLDSASSDPLTAVLEGAVDGYAPVRIEAGGQPFAADPRTTLTLDFHGLDIATMTPYSGTYAGYAIDSGSLSTTLRYRLDGEQVDGQNRFVISQMRLGEAIESDRALQLPLKLGLALLTDTRGVIDLDIPISGDVNDPEFSIGRVIGRAIANVITKAATAPFRLLAGLVNSDQDLESVSFAAGSAELDAGGRDALSALAQALEQRPGLQLGVAGAIDQDADGRVLRQRQLDGELLAAGLSEASVTSRDLAYQSAVAQRYRALAPPLPDDGTAPDTDAQLAALREQIVLPPTALRDLATARATAVKRELVTIGGVDASRIAVSYDAALGVAVVRMSIGT